jgi:hypothetical protein
MAVVKSIIDNEGYVNSRDNLANLALQTLGIKNFGIRLDGENYIMSQLIGYRVGVPYGTGSHFVLTGIDKSLVYNPGNTFTSDQSVWKSILRLSVYGK